jgi:hypothetical protein
MLNYMGDLMEQEVMFNLLFVEIFVICAPEVV